MLSFVKGTLDYADFSDVDMVIEVSYLHVFHALHVMPRLLHCDDLISYTSSF